MLWQIISSVTAFSFKHRKAMSEAAEPDIIRPILHKTGYLLKYSG